MHMQHTQHTAQHSRNHACIPAPMGTMEGVKPFGAPQLLGSTPNHVPRAHVLVHVHVCARARMTLTHARTYTHTHVWHQLRVRDEYSRFASEEALAGMADLEKELAHFRQVYKPTPTILHPHNPANYPRMHVRTHGRMPAHLWVCCSRRSSPHSWLDLPTSTNTYTHARTHTYSHAGTHMRHTHARTHAQTHACAHARAAECGFATADSRVAAAIRAIRR